MGLLASAPKRGGALGTPVGRKSARDRSEDTRHGAFPAYLLDADPRGRGAPAAAEAARVRSVLAALVPATDDVAALHSATLLLKSFGSLDGLFAATGDEIDRVVAGAGAIVLAARDLSREAAREGLSGSIVDADDPALHRYIRLQLGASPVERARAVFGDRRRRFLADEELALGGDRAVTIDLRTFFRRAFALDAAMAVLVHNHPSGDARPSAEDIRITRRIAEFGSLSGVDITDHLIVTRTAVFSMRRAGLL
jgi:DNA repair protein RadC